MADKGGKVSYWREVTLVYSDEEITVVLPAPIVAKLEEGDMKLMAEIKKNTKETGAPLPAGCPKTPMPSPESNSEPSTCEKELPKVWSKKDTELLFHARIKLEKDFSEARSHKTLWEKIAKELKNDGCVVTAKQCENEFKSLKREYRATIDYNNKSGNSELYGMRGGTRPKFTTGSLSGSLGESS